MTNKMADKFINALGGTAEVSRLRKVAQNTVSNWRNRGIPLKHLLPMIAEATDREIEVPKTYKDLLP